MAENPLETPETLAAAPPIAPAVPPPDKVAGTTPPAKPEAAPSEPQVSARAARLAELGFANVQSDDEAFDRLASAYQQQRDDFGAQLKSALEQVRQTAPPPASAADAAPDKWWNPPQVDLQLAARYRTPDGKWTDDAPPDVRAQVAAWERYRAQFAEKLLSNPKDALAPLLKESFAEFFDEHYGKLAAQQAHEQFFAKAYAENDWLFEKDPHSGKPRSDRLSAEGQRVNDLMIQAAREYGIADPVKQFQFVMKQRDLERAAAAARPTAEDARAEKQQQLLGRAGPGANRDASLKPSPAPPNKNLSPGQRLWQLMQREGVTG